MVNSLGRFSLWTSFKFSVVNFIEGEAGLGVGVCRFLFYWFYLKNRLFVFFFIFEELGFFKFCIVFEVRGDVCVWE